MGFSKKLLKIAEPFIQAEIKKPFLNEMAKGILGVDKFQYYMNVDYPYLFDFSQILALAVYKSEDLPTMNLLVKLINANMKEMELNSSYLKKFHVSPKELTGQEMGPIKYAYTRHELACAQKGLLGELMCGLLPCEWGYGEVARRLVKAYPIQPDNLYKDWFDFYTSSTYEKQGEEFMWIIDQLASTYSSSQLHQLQSTYLKSFYYEVVCWDAYYEKENWKI